MPDTVEVWNIGPWAYQNPLPSANDNNFSLLWYDGFLQARRRGRRDRRQRLALAADRLVQGVGDPTTWVYVTQRSIQGVLDGLQGAPHVRLRLSRRSQDGAQLYLEADANHDGRYEAIAGRR